MTSDVSLFHFVSYHLDGPNDDDYIVIAAHRKLC